MNHNPNTLPKPKRAHIRLDAVRVERPQPVGLAWGSVNQPRNEDDLLGVVGQTLKAALEAANRK